MTDRADRARNWRGIVHAHSAYSHDGARDLESLVELMIQQRLNFVFLTEHVEDITAEIFARYVGECRAKSTHNHLLIPGIEYTFEDASGRIEVLLIGEDAYVEAAGLADVWEWKKRRELLAILPHPVKFGALPRSLVDQFELIEVWNLRYDGGYFPPWSNIALYNEQKKGRAVYAVCGPDYHGPGDRLDLVTVIEAGRKLDGPSLITALKRGAFHSEYRGLRLAADLQLPARVVVAKSAWRLLRRMAYRLGRSVVSSGLARRLVPAGLKGRIRNLVR